MNCPSEFHDQFGLSNGVPSRLMAFRPLPLRYQDDIYIYIPSDLRTAAPAYRLLEQAGVVHFFIILTIGCRYGMVQELFISGSEQFVGNETYMERDRASQLT